MSISEREKLEGCLRSFFRARHEKVPMAKTGKRAKRMVSAHADNCRMVRHYIQRIRALDAEGYDR